MLRLPLDQPIYLLAFILVIRDCFKFFKAFKLLFIYFKIISLKIEKNYFAASAFLVRTVKASSPSDYVNIDSKSRQT